MPYDDLEERIRRMYAKAAVESKRDLDSFLSAYKDKDEAKRAMLEAGKITEKDYTSWRTGQLFQKDALNAKIEDLTQRMVHADEQAAAMTRGELPGIYATNYNFAGYLAEKGAEHYGKFDFTPFTIINQDSVRELMTKDPDLIPWMTDEELAKRGITKDMRWNRQHIQNAIQQGLVKGDSMDEIANRLLPVVNMDCNAALRTARTATNGVENKGRMDATERVAKNGIPMVLQWSCTHDNRTRDSHALLDGEQIKPGEKFSNGLEYPGDPAGDPAEVYNCRCTLLTLIAGVDHSRDEEDYERWMNDDPELKKDYDQFIEEKQAKEQDFQELKEKAEEKASGAGFEPTKEQLQYEDRIRKSTEEHGAFFDSEGNILLESSGGENEVEFDNIDINHKVEQKVWAGEKIDFTHNHPGNTIFSPGDLEQLESLENNSCSAVLPNGTTYRLERNQPISSNTWIYDEELKDYRLEYEPKKIAEDYDKEYMQFYTDNKPSRPDFDTHVEYRRAVDEFFSGPQTEHMEQWLEENAPKRGYIFIKEKKR